MEYVEHTNKVLYNLVRANASTRILKNKLSAIFAHFITHYWFYKFILCIINVLHKLKYGMR